MWNNTEMTAGQDHMHVSGSRFEKAGTTIESLSGQFACRLIIAAHVVHNESEVTPPDSTITQLATLFLTFYNPHPM